MDESCSTAPIQVAMRREEEGIRGTRDFGHIPQETKDHHLEMKLKLQ